MIVLTSKQDAKMLDRIHELEQLHDFGHHSYLDTFELDELLITYMTAWRVIEGGKGVLEREAI